MSNSELAGQPCHALLGFEAYTGTPIHVDGAKFGTLCFASAEPRENPFSDSELSLLQLFATWIGGEIERAASLTAPHENQDALTRLHAVTAGRQSSPTENILQILDLGRSIFGGTMGIVGRVEGDSYVFAHVSGTADAPPEGTRLPMADTYCQFAFKSDGPIGVHNVHASDWASEPCYEKLGLEAYIGTPVYVEGERYGTLCFANHDARAKPFSDSEFSLVQLFASWVGGEITRHQAAARDRLLARVLESTREGFWQIDNEYKTVDVNPAICDMLGYDREQIVGHSVFEFVDGKNAETLRAQMQRRTRHQHDLYEIEFRRSDGTALNCINNATPTFDDLGNKNGSVGLLSDIREIKQTEEELRRAKERAETATESKSRFLASASHDLRQPLQALNLFVAILKRTDDPQKRAETVDKLEASINVLGGLLNTLLDLSKLEAGLVMPNRASFPIDDLFNFKGEFDSVAASNGVEFRIVHSALNIDSGPTLLDSVLRNLISNAIKYTKSGKVLVGCRRRGRNVRIEVHDTGIGIAPGQRRLIFEEFYQVDNSARHRDQGIGLGLSIVERTAKLLGHTVEVDSEPAVGSVFSIEVPLAEDGDAKVAVLLHEDACQEQMESLVLLIDDDATVLAGMEALLTELGCSVVSSDYSDGEAAEDLRLVKRCPRKPDLIIADYRLPGGRTGTDVVGSLREKYGDLVPAILLTGELSQEFLGDSLRHGLHVLNKPVNAEQLISAMGIALEDS